MSNLEEIPDITDQAILDVTDQVVAPEQPVAAPEQPVAAPEQPVAAPEQPVAAPEQPVAAPEQPAVDSHGIPPAFQTGLSRAMDYSRQNTAEGLMTTLNAISIPTKAISTIVGSVANGAGYEETMDAARAAISMHPPADLPGYEDAISQTLIHMGLTPQQAMPIGNATGMIPNAAADYVTGSAAAIPVRAILKSGPVTAAVKWSLRKPRAAIANIGEKIAKRFEATPDAEFSKYLEQAHAVEASKEFPHDVTAKQMAEAFQNSITRNVNASRAASEILASEPAIITPNDLTDMLKRAYDGTIDTPAGPSTFRSPVGMSVSEQGAESIAKRYHSIIQDTANKNLANKSPSEWIFGGRQEFGDLGDAMGLPPEMVSEMAMKKPIPMPIIKKMIQTLDTDIGEEGARNAANRSFDPTTTVSWKMRKNLNETLGSYVPAYYEAMNPISNTAEEIARFKAKFIGKFKDFEDIHKGIISNSDDLAKRNIIKWLDADNSTDFANQIENRKLYDSLQEKIAAGPKAAKGVPNALGSMGRMVVGVPAKYFLGPVGGRAVTHVLDKYGADAANKFASVLMISPAAEAATNINYVANQVIPKSIKSKVWRAIAPTLAVKMVRMASGEDGADFDNWGEQALTDPIAIKMLEAGITNDPSIPTSHKFALLRSIRHEFQDKGSVSFSLSEIKEAKPLSKEESTRRAVIESRLKKVGE